ncbi:hypothetical protein CFRS1_v010797 [Colletotrichum fructicola]|nr:hypothetical protein CFRS1_v010797 [Colletotrichum fructicola]
MLDEHIHENVQLLAFGNKEIAQAVARAAGVGLSFSLPASPAGPPRCMAGNVVSPIQGGRLPDRCLILAVQRGMLVDQLTLPAGKWWHKGVEPR